MMHSISQSMAECDDAYLSLQTTREAKVRRITVSGQPKKVCKTYLNGKKLGMVAHACHPSDSRKHKIGLWYRSA
jgi:hypothetical protein